MKVKDFEKAIIALSTDIVIDQMKLRHSDVRQVNAHTGNQLIVWDEHGRAFTACKEQKRELFLTDGEDGGIVGTVGIPLNRDKSFDLKFE